MDWYLFSILVFVLFFALLIYKDRKNIEIKAVLFIRKTKRGVELLDRIARVSPRFWKIFGSVGVIVCFGGMIYGFNYLLTSLLKPSGMPTISLVIPFPSKEPAFGYGYIGVPFWYFILGVMSLIFVHEGLHGVIARAEKIKIKSVGLLLLLVIPGAFVEPDEKQLKKANWKTKLRIYAAGSFANFLLAGIITLLLTFVITPVFLMDCVGYRGYVNASHYGEKIYPAQAANMTEPIISIDGERVKSVEDLSRILSEKKPGDVVMIETYSKTYNITLAKNPDDPNKGFIGIYGVYDAHVIKKNYTGISHDVIKFIVELLSWMWTLNVGVGLVNIFPIKPLDGGLMVEALCEKFAPRYKKIVVNGLSLGFILLIVCNFVIGFIA